MRIHARGALAALLLILLLIPASATAHQRLLRAEPARDATTDSIPTELRLVYYEPAELAFTRVELFGPDGAPVTLGEPSTSPDSAHIVVVPIEGRLTTGRYRVTWRTAGADGHPVQGEYTFTVAEGARGSAPPADRPEGEARGPSTGIDPAPSAHHPSTMAQGAEFGAESPGYVLVRWLTFIAVLGVIGAVAFRLLVLPVVKRQRRPEGSELVDSAAVRAARAGTWFALLLVAATVARLAAQWYAIRPAGDPLDLDALRAMLTRTVWGWGWTLQALAAAVALGGFLLAARRIRGGWALGAVGAVAIAFTPALSGHAAATPDRAALAVLSDGIHILSAGGWLGSLLVLLVAGIPAASGLGEGRRGAGVAALVSAFSPTALFFAAVVIATGVFAAWLHLGPVQNLWQSEYGRTLLLKLGVFALVFGTGAYNYLRVMPALGRDTGTRRLRRSAGFELAVGAVILAVTAVLVATSPPMDMQEPAEDAGPAASDAAASRRIARPQNRTAPEELACAGAGTGIYRISHEKFSRSGSRRSSLPQLRIPPDRPCSRDGRGECHA